MSTQPNSRPSGPAGPSDIPHQNSNHNVVVTKDGTRILCIADIRGDLSLLNTLAASTRASAVIHTGDFGFYDENSLHTISEKYALCHHRRTVMSHSNAPPGLFAM